MGIPATVPLVLRYVGPVSLRSHVAGKRSNHLVTGRVRGGVEALAVCSDGHVVEPLVLVISPSQVGHRLVVIAGPSRPVVLQAGTASALGCILGTCGDRGPLPGPLLATSLVRAVARTGFGYLEGQQERPGPHSGSGHLRWTLRLGFGRLGCISGPVLGPVLV